MKNLLVYYFAILLPIPFLIWAAFNDSYMFTIMLLSYYLYRTFLDGGRLISLGILEPKSLWKSFIPFWTTLYFKEMYFGK